MIYYYMLDDQIKLVGPFNYTMDLAKHLYENHRGAKAKVFQVDPGTHDIFKYGTLIIIDKIENWFQF